MSTKDGLYTEGAHDFAPKADSIPLVDVDTRPAGEGSIGDLISDATTHMSTLFRSEVELAKAELAAEAKKGAVGGGLFGVAGAIVLYSTFFFFFFVAALLSLWLPVWAATLIVFLLMLAVAGSLALVGFKKVRGVSAPKETIESVNELKKLVPGKAQKRLSGNTPGMYT